MPLATLVLPFFFDMHVPIKVFFQAQKVGENFKNTI
jgi:hypothetical protein